MRSRAQPGCQYASSRAWRRRRRSSGFRTISASSVNQTYAIISAQNDHLAVPIISTSWCDARMAARRRSHRSVPSMKRNRALEVRSMRAGHPGPHTTKALSQEASILNSSRRYRTSPRRGRLVDWSDQFARLICRRCASNASYESVGYAGSIDVTTTDVSLVIDSVKRCRG